MDFLDFLGGTEEAAVVVPADDSSDEESVASAPSALALSLARLRQNITRDSYAQIEKQGFLVLDNVFEEELARTYSREIELLHTLGHTALNSTAFVREHVAGALPSIGHLIPKPHVYETELTVPVREKLQPHMPNLCALYEALPKLEAHLSLMRAGFASASGAAGAASMEPFSVGEGRSSIKVQHNLGSGGCFPFHFDSPGGSKDTRRITCLLYLNEGWAQGHGGHLTLQPFLTPAVSVAPKFNRVVLFKSDTVLHRVQPAIKQRKCLTIWMHCKKTNNEPEKPTRSSVSSSSSAQVAPLNDVPASSTPAAPASAPAPVLDADAFAALWGARLSDPVWQRVLARAVYLDPWRQSFFEAHGRAGDSSSIPQHGGGAAEGSQSASSALAEAAAQKVAYANSGGVAEEGETVRGAEPLVASLEADAARLEVELRGTGILELLKQTAEEQKAKAASL